RIMTMIDATKRDETDGRTLRHLPVYLNRHSSDVTKDYPAHLALARSSVAAAWIAAATFTIKATLAAGVRPRVAPISSANIASAASIASAARSVAVFTIWPSPIRSVACMVIG